MTFDLASILSRRQGEKYALHEKHLNTQLVRVLKTLGYDVNFARGEGPHLYDVAGRRYLDLLSGFGVFALGRNHPAIAAALRQVLEAQLPGLVQLDVSLLAGVLADRKRVVEGTGVSVRVGLGGGRLINKKKKQNH